MKMNVAMSSCEGWNLHTVLYGSDEEKTVVKQYISISFSIFIGFIGNEICNTELWISEVVQLVDCSFYIMSCAFDAAGIGKPARGFVFVHQSCSSDRHIVLLPKDHARPTLGLCWRSVLSAEIG